MTFYLLIAAILACMFMSLRTLFIESSSEKRFSIESLIWVTNLYGTILIGFALIYLLFELDNHAVFLDNGFRVEGDYIRHLETSFYFSAMTMFSVGYGDVAPIGIGRTIAAVQAFIGYTLPAAFVIRTVIDFEQNNRRK
ncbi:potassium channel LctB [Bacillus sp. OV322]|uniref:ion channel n=1 Tax=Bacillus sp. OV322 TaxID=1882764 RepID=UPI0008E2FB34|nr:ion channel [Bacillus sp. OV322]SFC84718.1 potassium channel LctB [Bacillus sp. OV322]